MVRPVERIVDAAGLLGLAWLGLAVYESFTRSGLWLVIDRAFGSVVTMPGQMAVLGVCILAGWSAIAAVATLVCYALARGAS